MVAAPGRCGPQPCRATIGGGGRCAGGRTLSAKTDDARVQVTAPNGVTWTRRLGGTSTGAQFLRALDDYIAVHDISRRWNWWEEGREEQERQALWAIVSEWDNGAPASTSEDDEAFLQDWEAEWDRKRQAEEQRRADVVA